MEAILLVEGVGGFIGFEQMEELLTLDELLLLHKELAKVQHARYRIQAALAGQEVPDLEFDEEDNDEELPPEVLEAERAWKKKKEEHMSEQAAKADDMSSFGLGYSVK